MSQTQTELYAGATDTRYRRLHIQRVKTFPFKWEIRQATRAWQPGEPLCYAHTIMGLPWRTMKFTADAAGKEAMFSYRARYPLLTKNTFDIVDINDGPLGYFSKGMGKSFFNATIDFSTYRLEGLGKDVQLLENKIKRLIDYGGAVNFTFVLPNIKEVMYVRRGYGEHDPYRVEIIKQPDGRQMDWRVAAALATGMDHMLNHMRG